MKRFYSKNKKFIGVFLILIGAACFFWVPLRAGAEGNIILDPVKGGIGWVIGEIAVLIVQATSFVLLFTMKGVISIAEYNDFIREPGIVAAWVIIRDFCNMLFILVLLIIAFATILRQDNYSVKKLLPKLLIMAVLINFSKSIIGLLIDASQVVMLTFVSSFSSSDGSFVSLMGVDQMVTFIKDAKGGEITLTNVTVSAILAVVFMLVATIAMLAILIVFTMRVVMLWIYVALSPLAFLLSVFPGGQQYASKYWKEVQTYLINGPILAFFIWLALATMATFNIEQFTTDLRGSTEIFNGGNFMSFVLAIAFLIGGLKTSSEIGGIGAGWGSKKLSELQSKGMAYGKKGVDLGKKAAGYGVKQGAKASGRLALGAVAGMSSWAADGDKTKQGVVGTLATNWKKDLVETNNKNKAEARLKLLKKMGMKSEETIKGVGDIANTPVMRGIKGAATAAVGASMVALTGGLAAVVAGAVTAAGAGQAIMGGYAKGWGERRKAGREANAKVVEDKKEADIKAATEERDKRQSGRNQLKAQEIFESKGSVADHIKTSLDIHTEKLAELSKNRDEVKNKAERQYKSGEIDLAERDKKITDADNNYTSEETKSRIEHNLRSGIISGGGLSPAQVDALKNQIQHAEFVFNGKVGSIEKQAKADLATIESQKDFRDNFLDKYIPNRVTVEAAKEGTKEIKEAKDLKDILSKGGLGNDFQGSKFYSASGQTSGQKKLFDQLADGTKESVNAINNMVKDLKAIALKGDKASAKELALVKSLKQGLAAYEKGGKSISVFQPVTSELNSINNGNDPTRDDHRWRVEDFKSAVK